MQSKATGRWLACGVLVLAVLVACGGGGTRASEPMSVQGALVDTPSEGSRVYLDLNNNQSFDAGEPLSQPMAADGTFRIEIPTLTAAQLATATFVVDTSRGKLLAPAAAFVSADLLGRQRASGVVISPLTTLVAAEVTWNGLTSEEAVAFVQQQLGLGSANPLADYLAIADPALVSRALQASSGLAQLKQGGTPEGESDVMYMGRLTRAIGTGSAFAALPQAAQVAPTEQHFIVRLRDDIADPDDKAQKTAAAHKGAVRHVYTDVMKGFAVTVPASDAEAFVNALQQDKTVEKVEYDLPVKKYVTQFSPSWGLDRVDQRYLELDQRYSYDATGAGVTAYVIDTGIRATHVELKGRVLKGFTAIDDGQGTNDCNGHGTHVAGTIGGTTFGVAKAVRLVPVRVLGCSGSGLTSGVIAGFDWVAKNATKPAVVNVSLGSFGSDLVDEAVARVVAAGIPVIVAAGNDSDNACNYSPARAPTAFAVAASDASDVRSSFSNNGPCVMVFAPGSSIKSAYGTSDTATATLSGTSMASPHVAGLVALYLQTHPTASPAFVMGAIWNSATKFQIADAGAGTVSQLIYADFASASPVPDPSISTPISTPISAPPLPPPPSLSVAGLTGSALLVKTAWQAKATVAVQNQAGALQAAVTVKGIWSTGTKAVTCKTATNGTCVLASPVLGMSVASVQFTVTGMEKKGAPAYDPSANVQTLIVISRPGL